MVGSYFKTLSSVKFRKAPQTITKYYLAGFAR